MGLALSTFFRQLFNSNQEYRILMLGLDAAGKTTILYKLKMAELISTIPTIGFNVETIEYRNICFTIWDVGGQKKIRTLWRHYYTGTQGLIFVVDSNDPDRLEVAAQELHHLLGEDELQDAVVLVLANKQDLPNAVSAAEMSTKMQLSSIRGHEWYVQPCSATVGDGLYEGLDWLAGRLSTKRRRTGG